MGGKIQDISTMQDVLHESMTGLWIIEIEEGCNSRMFADETMLDLLGLTEEASPEECYEHWYRNIDKEYYPVVNSCVDNMIRQGRAEVQYPWQHPVFGRIYIRCGGVAERISEKILRLRGYHQNVTDTIVMRREKEKLEELNEEIVGSLHNLFLRCIGLIWRVILYVPFGFRRTWRKYRRRNFLTICSGMILQGRHCIPAGMRI
ncbi:hypothetical protein [Eisenbergiella porci]|uniref:hypothetical protein n=1 Tax=Eisenbergiella porci TaxID=2652274 RepID=UPI002A7EC853|nr:hypothetical protein [Eisenbergiella porci]